MWQGTDIMSGVVGWGGMILGPLIMIGIPVLIIVLLIALVRQIGSGTPSTTVIHTPADKSAQEILRERFARGEIDAREYEERLRTLKEATT